MQHVVIGAGEVGQAITEVLLVGYDNVHLRDVAKDGPSQADVLHICFPYSVSFKEYVEAYVDEYQAKLVIIHSTVPLGTSSALNAVHSPVRGKHPALVESLRTFVKFFGGPKAQQAADIFARCNVPVKTVLHSEDTEAGKLWELAQYGLAIAIEKSIYAYCEMMELDFNTVYTLFAETYNQGYTMLGDDQYVRPVLRHMPGPIGGHCVVPGSLMLNHPLASLVAEAR